MSLLNNLEIKENIHKDKPHTSSFIFQHLSPGMGITMGNFLRRFLLSYISGIAPIGVKISDKNGPVKTEVSVLAGVVDTVAVPYLIINLKKIILEEKKKKEGIFCLELNIENREKKEKLITAGDFQKDKEIEIKNPDLLLATLAAASDQGNPKLEIKLYCQKSWGYQEEEKQRKKYLTEEEDIIIFDTDYSPIKGGEVNFQVKPVVISQKDIEEELILTITTNGVIKPKKALQEALTLTQNSFATIAELISGKKKEIPISESSVENNTKM